MSGFSLQDLAQESEAARSAIAQRFAEAAKQSVAVEDGADDENEDDNDTEE